MKKKQRILLTNLSLILGLSQKNQDDWTRAIQLTKDTELEKNVILYLKKVIKRGISLDIPCYITKCSIERIRKTKFRNPEKFQSATVFEIFDSKSNLRNMGILQLVAPLMKNSNAPNSSGLTPIHWAAIHGFLCIIKILSPFVMNPNRKDGDGDTPIHSAAMNGHIEVIKFLTLILRSHGALFYLNVPNDNGDTPIHSAAMNGHIEVIKFLTSILPDGDLKFINVPNFQGETPLQLAKMNGNTKIINFLQNLEEKMELEMLEIPLD